MSKKIDQFYLDDHGNFRGLVYEISAITAPKENVVYDPHTAKLIVSGVAYDVGDPLWLKDGVPDMSVLFGLEKK
jgi:hypothetical protein